ncbi:MULTISPECIES: alpha/beta fold hydrolase [unclassified Streptomyces]|uniref:alpha/beta fold hydrolase n=1 Tax=unclassified Streptomyces TaxID=2593676 RepID=UPI00324B3C41
MSGLHVEYWGEGDRIAVLGHMQASSARAWWRLGPALADAGYRVIAPELPGHGRSPRMAEYSVEASTEALVEAIPSAPELVIAHSFSAILVARALDRIRPSRVVYSDPAWLKVGSRERFAYYRNLKNWTLDDVRAEAPGWAPEGHRARFDSIADWDAEAIEQIDGYPGYEPARPTVPSLIVTADPSVVIPAERAERLRGIGFEVRPLPGTVHVLHEDDFAGFWKSLDGWV